VVKIKIEIEDKPYKVPIRKDDKVFFGYESNYQIEEITNDDKDKFLVKTVHLGSTGSCSIKQIEEDFKRIIAHLKRQRLLVLSKAMKKTLKDGLL